MHFSIGVRRSPHLPHLYLHFLGSEEACALRLSNCWSVVDGSTLSGVNGSQISLVRGYRLAA